MHLTLHIQLLRSSMLGGTGKRHMLSCTSDLHCQPYRSTLALAGQPMGLPDMRAEEESHYEAIVTYALRSFRSLHA